MTLIYDSLKQAFFMVQTKIFMKSLKMERRDEGKEEEEGRSFIICFTIFFLSFFLDIERFRKDVTKVKVKDEFIIKLPRCSISFS